MDISASVNKGDYILENLLDYISCNNVNLPNESVCFKEVLYWYFETYRLLSNEKQELIKGKLKTILKIIRQLEHSAIEDSYSVNDCSFLGNHQSVEHLILKESINLSKVCNTIAHGSKNEYENKDFKLFYEKLVIIFSELFFLIKGNKLDDIIGTKWIV